MKYTLMFKKVHHFKTNTVLLFFITYLPTYKSTIDLLSLTTKMILIFLVLNELFWRMYGCHEYFQSSLFSKMLGIHIYKTFLE